MTYVLELPWPDGPPARSNDRLHWRAKANVTADIRRTACVLATQYPPIEPIVTPVTVTLVWTVTDKRRRDVGASSPTLKAALDGIVDARILEADDSRIVTEERCRIEHGTTAGLRIEIQPVAAEQQSVIEGTHR